ncbi:hypothetical protein F4802DRAFT_330509 [Xylaria palmicola]|nr:hypothetical protein F4802DRAFT_330509 [Xylaria palmicola]
MAEVTAPMRADVPTDVAIRQLSIANFDPRPANGVEILGIAVATCLLAFFLCNMLCIGLCLLRHTFSPTINIGDAPNVTPPISKTTEGVGKIPRSVYKGPAMPLTQTHSGYNEQQNSSLVSYPLKPGCNARMGISRINHLVTKRHYYTQILPEYRPVTRKRLRISIPGKIPARQKDTTLDMEEGLVLKFDAGAHHPDKSDHSTPPNGTLPRRESKSKSGDSEKSFLRHRAASL